MNAYNGTVISSTVKKIWESNGEIDCWGNGSPIRDFVYDKTLKTIINTRFEKLDERETSEKVKDVLGSKWEKYIQNVIKSVVKEEA